VPSDAREAKDESNDSKPDWAPTLPIQFGERVGNRGEVDFPNNPFAKCIEESFSTLAGEIGSIQKYYKSKFQRGGVDRINEFLKQNGFTIELQPMSQNSIAVAALINIPVKWKFEGESVSMNLASGETVAGALMEAGVLYYERADGVPVAELQTEGGERVFMTRYVGSIPTNDATAARVLAERLKAGMRRALYASLTFPKTKYEWKGELEDMHGVSANGWTIGQFQLQQRIFMNHKGASFEATGAGGAERSFRLPQPMVIDGPFLVWVETNRVISFAGLISKQHMADPGDF